MAPGDSQENWVEPRSLEEAIERRDQVLSELQDIQDQLGERNRIAGAQPTSDDEYWAWRGKAKVALKYKLAEYRRLKAWVQLNRSWSRTAREDAAERLSPVAVAKQMGDITRQLYSVFLAAGIYVDDRSEENLRRLAAIYERAATTIEFR